MAFDQEVGLPNVIASVSPIVRENVVSAKAPFEFTMSDGCTADALILTSNSPGSGSGKGTSSTSRDTVLPVLETRSAFILLEPVDGCLLAEPR